jgi:hypothetical protein
MKTKTTWQRREMLKGRTGYISFPKCEIICKIENDSVFGWCWEITENGKVLAMSHKCYKSIEEAKSDCEKAIA